MIKVEQSRAFGRAVKKLKPNQKADLDKAIKDLMKNPLAGQQKKGDISEFRVHKFKMVKQLTLILYEYQDEILTLSLMYLGSHENFYRDFKRSF